jgi:hypothetical protein
MEYVEAKAGGKPRTVETTVPTLTTVPASHGPTTHLNVAFLRPILIEHANYW